MCALYVATILRCNDYLSVDTESKLICFATYLVSVAKYMALIALLVDLCISCIAGLSHDIF